MTFVKRAKPFKRFYNGGSFKNFVGDRTKIGEKYRITDTRWDGINILVTLDNDRVFRQDVAPSVGMNQRYFQFIAVHDLRRRKESLHGHFIVIKESNGVIFEDLELDEENTHA
jgi:hypothetical protein